VPGFANGSASQAQFSSPAGIVIDSHGNLLVADRGNNQIRKIAPDGTTSTLAGNGAPAFQDGSGAEASFDSPYGLAIDGQDNLYVGDNRNFRIRKVTSQGETSTVAGNGMIGLVNGTLGPDSTTEFDSVGSVAVNAAGTILYVADEGNCAVRVIALPAP
jgi:DNA-binding beta-propeller fold protein YncE